MKNIKKYLSGGQTIWLLVVLILLVSSLITTPASAQSSGDGIYIGEVVGAPLGQECVVPITFANSSNNVAAAFDLFIQYDQNMLMIVNITPGDLLDNCGWEYFTYRITNDKIRIIAISDINNGSNHPDCYLTTTDGTLANMTFWVTDNTQYICEDAMLQFYWEDCGDNTLASIGGDTLFVSNRVFDTNGFEITADQNLPSYTGISSYCIDEVLPPEPIIRAFDFYNGRVSLDCGDDIVERGDINLNFIANEIADYVMFANFFIIGIDAFPMDPALSLEASDVNANGIQGQLSDLAYLYRILIGNAPPLDKGYDSVDTLVVIHNEVLHTIGFQYPHPIGMFHCKFLGEIDVNETGIGASHGISYVNYVDDTTRVLIMPYFVEGLPTFNQGEVFTYTGDALLVYAEAADWDNSQIPIKITVTDQEYLCGDVNLDGKINVSDALFLVNYIFMGGPMPYPAYVADPNCDGKINLVDAIYIVQYVFNGGDVPCADCP